MTPAFRHGPPAVLKQYRTSALRAVLHKITLQLRWATAWLDEVQDMDLDAALNGLADAKRIRRFASRVEKAFDEAATAEMIFRDVEVQEGAGWRAVLRPGSRRQEWNSTTLLDELIDREVDRQQAKHPDIPVRALRKIISETLWRASTAARMEWRSTELRKMGISPDDFSVSVPVPPTVDLRGEASYPNSNRQTKGERRWE